MSLKLGHLQVLETCVVPVCFNITHSVHIDNWMFSRQLGCQFEEHFYHESTDITSKLSPTGHRV